MIKLDKEFEIDELDEQTKIEIINKHNSNSTIAAKFIKLVVTGQWAEIDNEEYQRLSIEKKYNEIGIPTYYISFLLEDKK